MSTRVFELFLFQVIFCGCVFANNIPELGLRWEETPFEVRSSKGPRREIRLSLKEGVSLRVFDNGGGYISFGPREGEGGKIPVGIFDYDSILDLVRRESEIRGSLNIVNVTITDDPAFEYKGQKHHYISRPRFFDAGLRKVFLVAFEAAIPTEPQWFDQLVDRAFPLVVMTDIKTDEERSGPTEGNTAGEGASGEITLLRTNEAGAGFYKTQPARIVLWLLVCAAVVGGCLLLKKKR